jgi:GLPGLI family protein
VRQVFYILDQFCQRTATNAFGRRWIAYFSKEYKQNIGPYKFNGLPGLVFEILIQEMIIILHFQKLRNSVKN